MKPCRKHDGSSLARAIDWLIDDDMVAGLEQHGNTSWKLVPPGATGGLSARAIGYAVCMTA